MSDYHFIIVASGPSARGFVPPQDCKVIAVNGAVDWIKRADYFFSLDPSHENMKRAQKRHIGIEYHVAGFPWWVDGVTHYQRINKDYGWVLNDDSAEYWFKRWQCVVPMQTDRGKISTGNSAYGAINLAMHLGAKKVLLVGVDGTQQERVGGGYCKSLKHMPLLIDAASKQIDLYSINDNFSVPKVTIQEFLK